MSPADNYDEPESVEKKEDPRSKIGWWIKFIKDCKKDKNRKQYIKDGKAAYCEYELGERSKDDDETKPPRGYPIYHSSCEILESAYYARTPKVVARRRHGVEDDFALTMSLIAERAGQYLIDNGHFDEGMVAARGDFIHTNRATTQVIYKADIDDMGEATNQLIYLAPAPFDEILFTPKARVWSEITEFAYRFELDKEEAEEKFNPDGDKKLPYKTLSESGGYDDDDDDRAGSESKNSVLCGWECYCSHTKTVYWVSEEYPEDFLKIASDPSGLKGFFPSPSFAIASKPRNHLFPTPTFRYLEATANQLHLLYARMFGLIAATRRRFLADETIVSTELINALNSLQGNEWLSAGSISDVLSKGGLEAYIYAVPVKELVDCLSETMNVEQHFKDLFFEWSHIPDLLRGTSDPSETAIAQEIKQEAAQDTFKYNKKQMFDLARNSAEMMLDMALRVWSDEKFAQVCSYEFLEPGIPPTPPQPPRPPSEQEPDGFPGDQGDPGQPGHKERFFEALMMLRNDEERIIRIDFETDSTSFANESKEFARRKLVADTVLGGLQTIAQMEDPDSSKIALQTLLSTLETMGGSVEFADKIKGWLAQLEKSKENPPPPPPDVEMLKAQAQQQKIQVEQQKADMDNQLEMQKLQLQAMQMEREGQQKEGELLQKAQQMALDQRDSEFKQQLEATKMQIEVQRLELEKRNESLLEAVEAMKLQLEATRVQLEQFQAKAQAQESMMEEMRLAKEHDLETLKLALTPEMPTQAVTAPAAPSQPLRDIIVNVEAKPARKRHSVMRDEFGKILGIDSEELIE